MICILIDRKGFEKKITIADDQMKPQIDYQVEEMPVLKPVKKIAKGKGKPKGTLPPVKPKKKIISFSMTFSSAEFCAFQEIVG